MCVSNYTTPSSLGGALYLALPAGATHSLTRHHCHTSLPHNLPTVDLKFASKVKVRDGATSTQLNSPSDFTTEYYDQH